MIKFHPCTACPPGKMSRVHRSGWMRLLFRSRALYQCTACNGTFLVSAKVQTELGLRAQAERLRSREGPLQTTSPGGP